MLSLDGELLDAAEETGTVEKTINVFFWRGLLGLGCQRNWAALGFVGGLYGSLSPWRVWKRPTKKDFTVVSCMKWSKIKDVTWHVCMFREFT
jgi:hypothetical protein